MASKSKSKAKEKQGSAFEWQGFHPIVREWFTSKLGQPTPAQVLAWPKIASHLNTLLLAPTGSGKTLAAFLVAINRLLFSTERSSRDDGVSVLYISPLKALGVDVERNLQKPLQEISQLAFERGVECRDISIAIRSGDTSGRERAQIARRPPDILITTPESLYLMLTSQASQILQRVDTVIIDEIHSVVPTKRGTHLFLTLERLERLRNKYDPSCRPLQRIGLSATQRPLEEVGALLTGAEKIDEDRYEPRAVEIVSAGSRRPLDLTVDVPVEDMANLIGSQQSAEVDLNATGGVMIPSIWPAIHPRLLELIREHRSTMVFVNSRRLAERLASAINELADEEIMLAHHGSLSKESRLLMEERLKAGTLPAIAATSSLELGIDMGAVDLVIQIESPPSIAAGLQRIGRAGHQVDGQSKGVIIPKYRGDLVACAAATGRMLKGEVEETYFPRNPLDVLAQQIVAMVSMEPIHVNDLFDLVRQAAPYRELARSAFESVLDLLSGKYPSDQFSELRPRLNWDRRTNILEPRRASHRLSVLNAGTIPDRGLFGVFLADSEQGGGRRVGELDEEMVFETRPGDVFLLGASAWRVVEINTDRVLVVPAPGEPGRMPFWHGESVGRPAEFGAAVGAFAREMLSLPHEEARNKLETEHALQPKAAHNLLDYLHDQEQATEFLPSDEAVVIECFRDEIGDWRIAILSVFGARIHAPWATAISGRLKEAGYENVTIVTSDDGLMLRLPDGDSLPPQSIFLPPSDEVEQEVIDNLGGTALFATRFRENAARALLLPKHQPGRRTPLWLQRKRSADLLKVAAQFPRFPLILETYRECLRDVFDLQGLKRLLADIESRKIECRMLTSTKASPYASSLLFNFVGNFMYDGDAPLAEQKAARLALDQSQLRELLGEAELRSLLDPESVVEVGQELQCLDREFALVDADAVHDLLIQLGDLTTEGIIARCGHEANAADWVAEQLQKLQTLCRILEILVGGEARWIAVEDAVRYRDSLGISLPDDLPDSLLLPVENPWIDLVSRYGRTHLPFQLGDIANHFSVGVAMVDQAAEKLFDEGRWTRGAFLPDGCDEEWCDREVLRRLKRRSMNRLRENVKPVPAETLCRFLPEWQLITKRRKGLDGVLDVVEQLQGMSLPFSDWESRIFPSRVADFASHQLDELLAAGEIVWRGSGTVGENDGKIAFFMTDEYRELAMSGDATESELDRRVLELLQTRGAHFFDDIVEQLGEFPPDVLKSIWALVWSGNVSNDSLSPLRSLLAKNKSTRVNRVHQNAFRSRRAARVSRSEGRWRCLPNDELEESGTIRLTRLTKQLLNRYGIVTRELIQAESFRGGFSALYPVLKAMEDAGQVRRGMFIEGHGAAQFALPGTEDRLRELATQNSESSSTSESTDSSNDRLLVLAGLDPANPYGNSVNWPQLQDDSDFRPARAAGSLCFLDQGELVAYLSKSAKQLGLFMDLDSPHAIPLLKRFAETLIPLDLFGRSHAIKSINGDHWQDSAWLSKLEQVGFRRARNGLFVRY